MWTNVPKPTGADYQYANPQGKEFYDDPNVLYDDPNVFYDGVDLFAWVDVAKPIGSDTWAEATYPWSSANAPWQSPEWNLVAKPT
jgi:hypothetical protein